MEAMEAMERALVHDTILHGDALTMLATLPDNSIHCCVTSPPYFGLRDYGVPGQIGLEASVEEYVARLVAVFAEVRRVLRPDGTLWLNLGDSYAADGRKGRTEMGTGKNAGYSAWVNREGTSGLKPKDLIGTPWRVAFALQQAGWWLRSDIIWAKRNCMPESVADRPTRSHEYIFLLAKSERYYYDAAAIAERSVSDHPSGNGYKRHARLSYLDANGPRENAQQWQVQPTRNRRSVWHVATEPYSGAHFATFPTRLIEPCILAGCPTGGIALDPFFGSGTVGVVAIKHNRHYLGIELSANYIALAEERLGRGIQRVLWSTA